MLILTIFAVATVSGAFGMGFVLGFYASPEQKELTNFVRLSKVLQQS
jgi:hypothetical protein